MSQAGYIVISPTPPPVNVIKTVTGNAGGIVGPDVGGNINIVGAGAVTVTGNPGTNTLTITIPTFTWTRDPAAAIDMVPNNGYINTNAGLTLFTLPVNANVGDELDIVGEGAAGWALAQNAGQNIQFGNLSTAVGIGGALLSTNRYDTIRLICRVADTTFSVTAATGNLTIV
jgi:hypothetical protein